MTTPTNPTPDHAPGSTTGDLIGSTTDGTTDATTGNALDSATGNVSSIATDNTTGGEGSGTTGATADDGGGGGSGLPGVARELAEIAHVLREASAHVTAALGDPQVAAAACRAPREGWRAQRALVRAITDPAGLGWAPSGGVLGVLGAKIGGLAGTSSLPVAVMTTSLRLRIAAVARTDPALTDDPLVSRLIEAAGEGRAGVVGALRDLVGERGAAGALTAVSPVFSEVLALRALLDRNPLNDHTAWLIATGMGAATADPLTGLSNRAIARLDRGFGAAVRAEPSPREAARFCEEASLLGLLGDLRAIGPTGRALVLTVRGPDGVERYVLLAPGMRMGVPDDASPADLLGAFSSTVQDSGPYSRSLTKALADHRIPDGADLAMIGHSAGGAAVMSLSQDAALNARYRLTHVIAIGSPIDFKEPADPATWVASVTNQHDIIPSLDGQGAGNCFTERPGRYVVDYTDPTHLFPACHSLEHYAANIEHDLPEARAHIERQLAPYTGPVVQRRLYQLYDDARRPAGFPFLTVASRAAPTPDGPVELPARTSDAATLTAWFATDAASAAAVLGDADGAVPVRAGGRSLVALHVHDHRESTLGPHHEISLGVLVHDPWCPRPVGVWLDLLHRPHLRGAGLWTLATALSTPAAGAAHRNLWSDDAFTAPTRVRLDARSAAVTIDTPHDRILTFAGSLGASSPAHSGDLVLYSVLAGATLRSLVHTHGPSRLHLAPRARLAAAGDHPLADRLRALGLDGARPMLCLSSPHRMLRRDAGTPVFPA
ncbi:hypothetical protein [Actinomadura bangladeshensis]|uniref:Fungal lipase-like domain-containing protein n=1 Tax=Actinomadura bangladeshensis TaxID=453573 RepID=A0A6L9QNM6_9ACTN|nr:hypothetical protein [Actinomadura bangladeshensis]NEA27099.1 hypothetical protein [Actinomadura bangladeshensis]